MSDRPAPPPTHGGAGLSLLCLAFASPTGGGGAGRTRPYNCLRALVCVSLITVHALQGYALPVTPSLSYMKCIGLCSVLPPPLANFTRSVKPAARSKGQDKTIEELSRRIKELETKLGEANKENVRPNLSDEAVESLLSEEGVPKWMEKLGSALVNMF